MKKNLAYFLIRGQVLQFYRRFLKVSYRIQNERNQPDLAHQIRQQLRTEMQNCKHVEDEKQIKKLLADGKNQYQYVCQMMAFTDANDEKPIGIVEHQTKERR